MPVPAKNRIFSFNAFGHPNILATHPTTLELTTENHLTVRGDCIVGVRATCGPINLPARLKQLLTRDHGRVLLRLRTGSLHFDVLGEGSQELSLSHPHEMVVRKSRYASGRTVMVNADRAAKDIPREMVHLLRNPVKSFEIEFFSV